MPGTTDTLGWLRAHARSARLMLALTVALGEASGILLILQTGLLARIGNAVIFSTGDSLRPWLTALPLVVAARAALAWGSRRAAASSAAGVKRELRGRLQRTLALLGPVPLAGMKAGEVATTWVDAVEAVDPFFSRYLPQRAIATLLPFTVLAVAFPLDWISALVLLVTAVFLPLNLAVIGREAHERNQRMWSTIARLGGRFLDVLQGLATVRMFGATREMAREIERSSEEHRRHTLATLRVAFVSSFMLELLAAVSIAIVAVTCGFRLLAGGMSFLPAYFILLVAPEYFLSIRSLGTSYHARMEAVSAAAHIRELLDRAPPQPEAKRGAPGARVPALPPAIELRDVRFGYAARPILSDVSLRVRSGEHVAIAGASGAGKSTVLALLLGFASPQAGSVTVDGRPLDELDRDTWLERVAWMPQRPTLFRGTLRHNITLGRPGAGPAAVERALAISGLDELVARLPLGLETPVGEGGQGLSTGQIQRVALARLVLREGGLVLLDEPTAHLDTATADIVRLGIRELIRGRTAIVVTHRHREKDLVARTLTLRDGAFGVTA